MSTKISGEEVGKRLYAMNQLAQLSFSQEVFTTTTNFLVAKGALEDAFHKDIETLYRKAGLLKEGEIL
jgi:hypothetical protein